MPAGRKVVGGEVPRLPAPATWSAGSAPLTGALQLHTVRHQITVPFARPVLERADSWLGFEPGAVFVQLLREINRHGPDRWRLAVLRADGPGERLCRVTGVRPGAELLLWVTGKGRTGRVLRTFAAIRRLGIDPVDVSPPWFAGAGAALNADIAPRRYSADQHAAYRRLMERGEARRIHPQHRERVRDILVRLNASATPDDMNLPGFRLHPLKGEQAGYWAVTVSANWRVIFRFEEGHAADGDYLDYH